jgi:tetratricopeptide (TPR) repeat protein
VRSAAIENALLEDLATMTAASFETVDRAVESYETLAARAHQHGLVAAEVNVLIGMCYPLDWIDSERCGEVAERVLELSAMQSDPLLRARARTCGLYFRLWTGGWDDGKFQEFECALAELRQAAASDRGVLAVDLLGYSLLQTVTSRYRDAYRSATEGMTLAREAGDQNPYFNMAYRRATAFLPWILMFAGEWGNALRQVRTDIAVMQKNEDLLRAESLRIHDAWVRLHAMDFDAVRESCRTTLRLFEDSRQNIYTRFALIVAGQAETGAGNFKLAREYLSAARDRIDNGAKNAWYLRNQLEHGLTDLWLAQGDLAQARPQAERFLEVAQALPEHTYRALAWEANARVAMTEGSLDRARDCIDHALSAMEGFDVPLAAWQTHATAAEVCRRAGNEQSAQRHHERSRKTILMLADSLPAEEEALRQTFLSAAPIAKILGMSQNFAPAGSPINLRPSRAGDP